jgi:hypothetical protein
MRAVDPERTTTEEEVLNSCVHFRRRHIPQHALIDEAFRLADRGAGGLC